MKNIASSVDEYINSNPADVQARLIKIRSTILQLAPDAEESISYAMPAYKLYGRPLVYFAAFANHVGFYATPSAQIVFARELTNFKQGKGSIQFPLSDPLPLKLIETILKFRIKENEEKAKAKKKK